MESQNAASVTTHPNPVSPSDCGELHLHLEEPVVSSGAGAAAVQADWGAGAGQLNGH